MGLARAALWGAVGVALCALSACDSHGPRPAAVEVIDGAAWRAIPRAEDPFAAAMPEAVTDCTVTGVSAEDGLLDMDTGRCGFISAETELTGTIHEGERVQITYWHLALFAEPPAKGLFLVTIDGDEVVRREVDIPKLQQFYRPEFRAKRRYPVGCPVQVHVHNHGANTWKLYQIMAGGS